jgi:FtsP/CotA-like multicopper oxidase with cupredoxin domain
MSEEHREQETHAHMAHTATEGADGHAGHEEDHAEMGHAGHENRAAPGHAGMGHEASMHHEMTPNVTRPQLAVVGLLTSLALIASVAIPAMFVNLTYSAEEVGGAIMPPGMVMSRDTPAAAMREMAAVDPGEVSYSAPTEARGDQTLEPTIEDGVKVFDLDVSVIEWNILPDEQVEAYAFNRQVPGPRLRVTEGDRVRINVMNDLPEATSVHWHGMILPNRMDGAAEVTQPPIEPGESFTYEFTAGQAGTYFYHSHKEPDRQQGLGMYGALIVDPKDPARDATYDYDQEVVIQLQEWLERDGYTYPAMIMEGALPNYFTINGKSYPQTETVKMEVGERLRIRFIGSNNNFVHPMHVHGGPFEIVETDGNVVPKGARVLKDTVNVGPGERYDVIWEARKPGKWLLHCHIPHHTTNDNAEQEGGGGLMAVINVTE